jgi:hypothetical protein
MSPSRIRFIVSTVILGAFSCAIGQVNSFSDGSDGVFSPTTNTTIDLGAAPARAWDAQPDTAGTGVYDARRWAVVFKYASVNIPSNVTVGFKNGRTNPPVVWLVQGDVTINGVIDLNGWNSTHLGHISQGGPGGFAGGFAAEAGRTSSSGFGIGGGIERNSWVGGSYATPGAGGSGPVYGNSRILPLIGGSGGVGWLGRSGGGGGGAILIVASGRITVNGRIDALGGSPWDGGGGGSGGAIRLVSNELAGNGRIRAEPSVSGYGGNGRVRIESNTNTYVGAVSPVASMGQPGTNATLWPDDLQPFVEITRVSDVNISDPSGSLTLGSQDVDLPAAQAIVVRIRTLNVPRSWTVQLRVTPEQGANAQFFNAVFVGPGTGTELIWSVQVTPAQGRTALQARAIPPPTSSTPSRLQGTTPPARRPQQAAPPSRPRTARTGNSRI